MDNTSARQKVEAILGDRLSDEEMRLLGGCLDDLEKRAADHQKRLRRQEQEFTTVFEMVGQISARAMDAGSLIKRISAKYTILMDDLFAGAVATLTVRGVAWLLFGLPPAAG